MSDAIRFEEQSATLEQECRGRLGSVRAKSGTDVLLRVLPGAPILTVNSAAALIGRTYKPAAAAIERLVEAGFLRQVHGGRRNRAFEAPEVIAAFAAFERQLASPEGDTRTSE